MIPALRRVVRAVFAALGFAFVLSGLWLAAAGGAGLIAAIGVTAIGAAALLIARQMGRAAGGRR